MMRALSVALLACACLTIALVGVRAAILICEVLE